MSEGTKQVTVARDYEQGAVVIETEAGERRLAPDAARGLTAVVGQLTAIPGVPEAAVDRLTDEIEQAADDVEEGR